MSIFAPMFLDKFFLFLLLIVFVSGLGQDLLPKNKKSKWGFVNQQGEWVIKPKFSEVKPFSEGLSCVRKKNKWGYINKEGRRIIPFIYSDARSFINGLAPVRSLTLLPGDTRANHNQYKWGFIDTGGRLIIPFLFKSVQDFDSLGRSLVSLYGMKDGEQFWINRDGKAISPPFLQKEEKEGKIKLINERKDGRKVFKYIYPNGTQITKWYLNDFSLEDTLIKVWLPSDLENDTLPAQAFGGNAKRKLCAILNTEGEEVSDWYSEIETFRFGYAPVRKNHKYGFIDSTYNLIVLPKYREVSYLSDSIYKGQLDYGKTALLSYKGDELSLFAYDFIPFSAGLFSGVHEIKSKYRSEKKYAVFDKTGKQRTGWYDKIHTPSNDVFRVEDVRFSIHKSKTTYCTQYNYVRLASGELVSDWRNVTKTTWKATREQRDSVLTYLLLQNANILLDKDFFQNVFIQEFELNKNELIFSGGNFHNAMALVSKTTGKEEHKNRNGIVFQNEQKRFGYINWYGRLVVPYKYEQASAFRMGYAIVGNGEKYGVINQKGKQILPYKFNLLGAYGDGLIPYLSNKNKWGYITLKGATKIKPIYDEAYPFLYGFAPIRLGNRWGVINTRGDEVLEIKYRKAPKILSTTEVEVLESGTGYRAVKIR